MKPVPDVQPALALAFRSRASFANFIEAGSGVVAAARALAEGRSGPLWLWGAAGVGKTHLLYATARAVTEGGARAVYLAPGVLPEAGPGAIFEGLGEGDVLCLDDVGVWAGSPLWEQALFRALVDAPARRWLVAARRPPADTAFALPDLASRLGAGAVFQVPPLADAGKAELLVARAHELALDLAPGVVQYLLAHRGRDLVVLLALLERLHVATLEARRRPTLAFVKALMDSEAETARDDQPGVTNGNHGV